MSGDEQRQRERQHVFCVNSEPEFLDLVRELLQHGQYNVTTTNFVPQTFDQISQLQPALIIIDLVAGEQGGWDLLQKLARDAVTNDIPVIITSTEPQLLETAQADPERYGGSNVLAKPFRADELLDDVNRLIGEA